MPATPTVAKTKTPRSKPTPAAVIAGLQAGLDELAAERARAEQAVEPQPVTAPATPWRSIFSVHPCADTFPMLSDEELDELAADIKAHGLQEPIKLIGPWPGPGKQRAPHVVLDGRNRLAALERLGVQFDRDLPEYSEGIPMRPGSTDAAFEYVGRVDDPAAVVIALNIRRRHLSKEQQAELIVKTIEAGQTANDRAAVARSFSPKSGKKGGSTKDPVLAKAVTEAQKHGISKRTVQNARAKIQGKTPAPRKPAAAPVVIDRIVAGPATTLAAAQIEETYGTNADEHDDELANASPAVQECLRNVERDVKRAFRSLDYGEVTTLLIQLADLVDQLGTEYFSCD